MGIITVLETTDFQQLLPAITKLNQPNQVVATSLMGESCKVFAIPTHNKRGYSLFYGLHFGANQPHQYAPNKTELQNLQAFTLRLQLGLKANKLYVKHLTNSKPLYKFRINFNINLQNLNKDPNVSKYLNLLLTQNLYSAAKLGISEENRNLLGIQPTCRFRKNSFYNVLDNGETHTIFLTHTIILSQKNGENIYYVLANKDAEIGRGSFGSIKPCLCEIKYDGKKWTISSTTQVCKKMYLKGNYNYDRLYNMEAQLTQEIYPETRPLVVRHKRQKQIDVTASPLLSLLDQQPINNDQPIRTYYLVMPNLGDIDMKKALDSQTISSKVNLNNLKLCLSIAQSQKSIHDKNIAHCDIKPGNIVLTKSQQQVYDQGEIIDLGVSQKTNTNGPKLFGGTPAYSAPEILMRLKTADLKSSDIFSLGIVFLEVLGGDPLQYRDFKNNEPVFLGDFDPRYSDHDLLLCLLLASMTEGRQNNRPNIHQVVATLELIILLQEPNNNDRKLFLQAQETLALIDINIPPTFDSILHTSQLLLRINMQYLLKITADLDSRKEIALKVIYIELQRSLNAHWKTADKLSSLLILADYLLRSMEPQKELYFMRRTSNFTNNLGNSGSWKKIITVLKEAIDLCFKCLPEKQKEIFSNHKRYPELQTIYQSYIASSSSSSSFMENYSWYPRY